MNQRASCGELVASNNRRSGMSGNQEQSMAGGAVAATVVSARCGCGLSAATPAGGDEAIREAVRRRYAAAAKQVETGEDGCPCGCADPITVDLYQSGETAGLPGTAVQASLGCGNPVALAELREGEVVLDLGSGGGLDVLLSARRCRPAGPGLW